MIKVLLAVILAAGLSVAAPATAQASSRWTYVTVHYHDQTGGRYPVKRGFERMDNRSGLNYVKTRSCTGKRQCVVVKTVPGWSYKITSCGPAGRGRTMVGCAWSGSRVRTVYLSSTFARRASYRERLALVMHEAGHAAGLPHSKRRGAIMNPYTNDRDITLSKQDVRRLRKLYGR